MFHFFKNFKGNPDSLKQIHHEHAFTEDEFKDLYQHETFDQIITNFEQFKTDLEKSEEIVNTYLWSLWLFDGLEGKAYEQMQHYENIFKTDRWIRLKGHYAKWKKWYHLALVFYKDTDAEIYEEIDHIFIEFKDFYELGQYNKAVHFYEDHLYLSVGGDTLWIAEMYIDSLFNTNKHVLDAKDQVDSFLKTYPDHIPFLQLKAAIYAWIGQSYKDGQHIKVAIDTYKQLGQTDIANHLSQQARSYLESQTDLKKIVQKHISKKIRHE